MSASTKQMNTSVIRGLSAYSPVDAAHCNKYGIQKKRKQASTGGGRAWSEEEEAYLVQTRLQKMPYKHIANHLKKTELACRLHFHQLSHGSSRRKRANSFTSSGTSSTTHSPVMHALPSLIHEPINAESISPLTHTCAPPQPTHHQDPAASTLFPQSSPSSPVRHFGQPVAILPKPSPPHRSASEFAVNASLHLDCHTVEPPMNSSEVDEERLRQIYETHRATFWSVVAAEYGKEISPFALEEAWKRSLTVNVPLTPCSSPDIPDVATFPVFSPKSIQQLSSSTQETKPNTTSISSLLGIDASPRSPHERELIKRLENSRDSFMS